MRRRGKRSRKKREEWQHTEEGKREGDFELHLLPSNPGGSCPQKVRLCCLGVADVAWCLHQWKTHVVPASCSWGSCPTLLCPGFLLGRKALGTPVHVGPRMPIIGLLDLFLCSGIFISKGAQTQSLWQLWPCGKEHTRGSSLASDLVNESFHRGTQT